MQTLPTSGMAIRLVDSSRYEAFPSASSLLDNKMARVSVSPFLKYLRLRSGYRVMGLTYALISCFRSKPFPWRLNLFQVIKQMVEMKNHKLLDASSKGRHSICFLSIRMVSAIRLTVV